MKIQTLSMVIGNHKCNARCPFCVSKMTHDEGIRDYGMDTEGTHPQYFRRFKSACDYAKDCGVSTVLLTGKGEPTLHPVEISRTVGRLKAWNFPFVELQTNGIRFHTHEKDYDEFMGVWSHDGLTTICLSVVHWMPTMNAEIYGMGYPLGKVVDRLHDRGFSVRITCMLVKGYIEHVGDVENMIQWCQDHKVEQLTIRNIKRPEVCKDYNISRFVADHALDPSQIEEIKNELDYEGTRLMELMHGAIVYDYHGQNVCLSDCLTIDPTRNDELRQLIFFPDGHLRYDWQYSGAILL